MNRLVLVLSSFLIVSIAAAQDKWDLKKCVDYAWANNLTVRQNKILAEGAAINYKQAKWEQYPTANFSVNTGLQFGRSIDPTTNQFTTTQLLGQQFSLNIGQEVFNWHRIKNNIVAYDLENQASQADVEKVKNDIGLTVATYYLQTLLSREQMRISRVQMDNTMVQLQLTRKKVEAGGLPEINALTLESQYGTDSANYINSKAVADQNLLQLKALLNVDASEPFDIAVPPVDLIPVDAIADLMPESVYALAMKNQPAQKANEFRLRSLDALTKVAKAGMYPSLSVGGGVGTNFASPGKKITSASFTGYDTSSAALGPFAVGPVNYRIINPHFNYTQSSKSFFEYWDGWGSQLNNNFRQSIGFTISVPIANGGRARFAWERSKLNYKNGLIVKEQADQKLKNDIYQAYYSAVAALEKFNATKIAVTAADKTYNFAQKRYDLGLLSTFDLITSQNNLNRARIDLAYSQFDYVFKMKVLEFYKGMGLRLQ